MSYLSLNSSPESPAQTSPSQRAQQVSAYLAKCMSLLPASLYLSSEQRQRLKSLSGGGSGARARFASPALADPASVLQLLTPGQPRQKRKAAATTANPDEAKPLATKRELKRRLETRLAELRKRRKAAEDGKSRRKLKRKELTLRHRVTGLEGSGESKKATEAKSATETKSAKPVFNKDGKVLYSKFDLVSKEELQADVPAERRRSRAKQKRLQSRLVPAGKAGPQLLARLTKQNRRIEQLKAEQPEKAGRLLEKAKWEKAMARAEGVKVKDDAVRLARSAKRQLKEKAAKAKKWRQRSETVEQKQAERQEKRRANIKARKDARVSKKIERAKKKGRILPELHAN